MVGGTPSYGYYGIMVFLEASFSNVELITQREKEKAHSFIYSQIFVSAYYLPGPILGLLDTAVSEVGKMFSFLKHTSMLDR